MLVKLFNQTLKHRNNKISNPIIIIESTVFLVQQRNIASQLLRRNQNYYLIRIFVGYSPERINPGDKTKKMIDIVKVMKWKQFRNWQLDK